MDLSPKHRRELQSAGVKVILATGQAPSLKRPMNSISDARAPFLRGSGNQKNNL